MSEAGGAEPNVASCMESPPGTRSVTITSALKDMQ